MVDLCFGLCDQSIKYLLFEIINEGKGVNLVRGNNSDTFIVTISADGMVFSPQEGIGFSHGGSGFVSPFECETGEVLSPACLMLVQVLPLHEPL